MSPLIILACLVVYTAAITPDEKASFQSLIAPIISECSSQFGTSQGDIEAAKAAHDGGNLNPCFIGCFFKKVGVINEEGIFDPEAANTKAKQFFKGADDQTKLTEIAKICSSINDEDVPDGAQGCQRGKLLMECFTKNRGEFTPF